MLVDCVILLQFIDVFTSFIKQTKCLCIAGNKSINYLMLVVVRELEHEAHACLSCHGSWPAPGSLRKSRVWVFLTETAAPDVASVLQLTLIGQNIRSTPDPSSPLFPLQLRLQSHHPDVQRSLEHPRGPIPTTSFSWLCDTSWACVYFLGQLTRSVSEYTSCWWALWLPLSHGAAHRRPAVREAGATEPCGNECKYGAVIVSAQCQCGSHMAAHELPRRSPNCMTTSFWGAIGKTLFTTRG